MAFAMRKFAWRNNNSTRCGMMMYYTSYYFIRIQLARENFRFNFAAIFFGDITGSSLNVKVVETH